ncbi:MAG: hypothetical protein ACXABY_30590 [Candidatus Thorarchaeota archaeon]|jgi:hypothetical protein
MSNDNNNINTTLPSKEILVPQIQGFIKKYNRVKTTGISQTTGNEIETFEKVPRPLKQLNDKCWEDGDYLLKALGFCVGNKVTQSAKTGAYFRWLFFSKVPGGPKQGGGYWAWLRIGQIWSNSRQDIESGEFKENWWVTVGIKPYHRSSDSGFVIDEQQKSEEPQEAQSEEKTASDATDAIDAL